MEPWFEPWMGGIFGAAIGLLGGIYGSVVGICAPRGIARPAVMALHWFCIAIGVSFLIAAALAFANGQPWDVMYALGLPGVIGTILFGAFTPLIHKRYSEAEHRKMAAANLG
jgi:hypothetical protein